MKFTELLTSQCSFTLVTAIVQNEAQKQPLVMFSMKGTEALLIPICFGVWGILTQGKLGQQILMSYFLQPSLIWGT